MGDSFHLHQYKTMVGDFCEVLAFHSQLSVHFDLVLSFNKYAYHFHRILVTLISFPVVDIYTGLMTNSDRQNFQTPKMIDPCIMSIHNLS